MILLKSSILGAIGNEQKCKIEIVNIHRGTKSESLECNCNIRSKNRFSAYIAEDFRDSFFFAFWYLERVLGLATEHEGEREVSF